MTRASLNIRIALGIEYDGTAYNGWQRQKTGVGIQQLLEEALTLVANDTVAVTCAGRTDTGVHATGQVVHFDSENARSERGWLLGANTHLPADINVTWAKSVDDDFHARFSATGRRYRYRILNRKQRSALYRHRAWWVQRPLDEQRMQDAAQQLVGKHDFSSFRAAGCRADTAVREVTHISIDRDGDWVTLDISANAFLQHMVRNITGSLVAVGSGKESPQWLAAVLAARDRKKGGVAAPAHGLTFVSVEYPQAFQIPDALTSY